MMDLPQEPGWYWYVESSRAFPEMLWVIRRDNGRLAYYEFGHGSIRNLGSQRLRQLAKSIKWVDAHWGGIMQSPPAQLKTAGKTMTAAAFEALVNKTAADAENAGR
jgi:hypothetical protein